MQSSHKTSPYPPTRQQDRNKLRQAAGSQEARRRPAPGAAWHMHVTAMAAQQTLGGLEPPCSLSSTPHTHQSAAGAGANTTDLADEQRPRDDLSSSSPNPGSDNSGWDTSPQGTPSPPSASDHADVQTHGTGRRGQTTRARGQPRPSPR